MTDIVIVPAAPVVPPFPALGAPDFNQVAYTFGVAMPGVSDGVRAVAVTAHTNATVAKEKAVEAAGYVSTVAASAAAAAQSVTAAAAQVNIAMSAANNKGNWSALTGVLNMPASVVHDSKVWALRSNLANVAASQPGVSADWMDITPSESAYACSSWQAVVALTVASSNARVVQAIPIDASRTLLVINSATAVHAVVHDGAAMGPAVLVRSTAAAASARGVLVSTDRVLVASTASSTALEAVVLSLSGTAITVGSAAASTLSESASALSDPIAVGSSYVFGLTSASNSRALAITVSGASPTIGMAVNAHAGTRQLYVMPIDASRFLAFGTLNDSTVYATPFSVSGGSVLEKGTAASAAGGSIQTFVALSTGRFAVVYSNTAMYGGIISVSGTVATMTTVALGTGASINSGGVKVGDQLIVAPELNKVNVLTDVAGTATAGTAITVATGAVNSAGAAGYGQDYAAFVAPGAVISMYCVVKISGNNPVIHSSDQTYTGRVVFGGGSLDSLTGAPGGVLSAGGKSVAVIPRSDGTASAAAALMFGSAVRQVLLPPVPLAPVKQSDSVLWAAQQAMTSTKLRIHRLELA